MRFKAAILVLLTSILLTALGQDIRDLGSEKWTVSSSALNRTVPGYLPSHVHLDLLKAGVIDDPYHGLNDFDLRWIADSNWTYTSDLIKGVRKDSPTWLVFDGLDTFAWVSFCGVEIGYTANQFRQYAFDVSHALKSHSCRNKDPVVSIRFCSAPEVVDKIAANPLSEKWPFQMDFELPNRWFMRKEQSDFGWDWGPAFSPVGPWKPAYLVQFDSPESIYVLNTDIDIYRKGQINYLPPDQNQPWVVNASVDYLGFLPDNSTMKIEIKDAKSGDILTSRSFRDIIVSGSSITGVTTLDGISPKLWWPNGLGPQNLYNLSITVRGAQPQSITRITKRTGFRTIFLNQRNITDAQLAKGIAPGSNWHFEINGHEFYAKGSNLIPPDSFWPRVTEAKMSRLFDAVVVGNQNMLRVWASGAYLHDFIYDLADERGILLWSEFQFSDAMYPTDNRFLRNVAAEVVYNVRRVNHHPSLALWAGGNEIESLILPLMKKLDPHNSKKYVDQYEKLYISLILPLVYENTRSISYSPSSTTEGYLSINMSAPVPMVQRYHNTELGSYYGDTDYYNYDSSVAFDYHKYPVGRFANEFGFHSMPSVHSWRQAVDPADLYFNSSVVMLRNHHMPPGSRNTSNFHNTSIGMGEMTIAVERFYPIPSNPDMVTNFSSWCHATQLFQADFYKSQIQFYRRGSGRPERQLGSLYWQLEDIWQAPTWAGIEYDGRWKVLHYVAKDIYQPVIVSPFWNHIEDHLEIYVTSDLWEPVSGTVHFTWMDLFGNLLTKKISMPESVDVNVGPLNTTLVYRTNLNHQFIRGNNSVLRLSVSVQGRAPNSNTTTTFTHENVFIPTFPKDLDLRDPKINQTYDEATNTVTVEAGSAVSFYTWLEHPEGVIGYFKGNAFLLVPGQKKTVEFVVQEVTDSNWMKRGFEMKSLWDQLAKS